VSQNSIIYQSPSAELLVEGGTLTVATGIRANGGILNYTQSGGTVTVGRYSTEDGSPIFGIADWRTVQYDWTKCRAEYCSRAKFSK
jgi:hypothetical protein